MNNVKMFFVHLKKNSGVIMMNIRYVEERMLLMFIIQSDCMSYPV